MCLLARICAHQQWNKLPFPPSLTPTLDPLEHSCAVVRCTAWLLNSPQRLTISASLQLKCIYHRSRTPVRPIFRASLLQISPIMVFSLVYYSRKRRCWWAGKKINMVHADCCSATALCSTFRKSRRSPLEPPAGRPSRRIQAILKSGSARASTPSKQAFTWMSGE